jgi:hypothetical protein
MSSSSSINHEMRANVDEHESYPQSFDYSC